MMNKGFDSTEYLEELETDWGLLKKSMKELEEIPPEEDVFIWLNLSPDSLCILYYLVNFFHNKSNNLFIISLPAFQVTQKSANSYKIKYCYYWVIINLVKNVSCSKKRILQCNYLLSSKGYILKNGENS